MLGICFSDSKPPRDFFSTLTGKVLPTSVPHHTGKCFKTNKEMYLDNGDKCSLDQHVIVRMSSSSAISKTFIGCIKEIVQIKGSIADSTRLMLFYFGSALLVHRPTPIACHL